MIMSISLTGISCLSPFMATSYPTISSVCNTQTSERIGYCCNSVTEESPSPQHHAWLPWQQKTNHLKQLRQDTSGASCIISNVSVLPNQPHLFLSGGSHDHHLSHQTMLTKIVTYEVGVTILPTRFQGPQVNEKLRNLL